VNYLQVQRKLKLLITPFLFKAVANSGHICPIERARLLLKYFFLFLKSIFKKFFTKIKLYPKFSLNFLEWITDVYSSKY